VPRIAVVDEESQKVLISLMGVSVLEKFIRLIMDFTFCSQRIRFLEEKCASLVKKVCFLLGRKDKEERKDSLFSTVSVSFLLLFVGCGFVQERI